jgi:hypothetical protein
VQLQAERAQRGVRLLMDAEADRWCDNGGLRQQPRQRDVTWLVAQPIGRALVLLHLVALDPQRRQRPTPGQAGPPSLLPQELHA